MEELDQPLSRRRLLQLTAGGVSAVALARALAVADGAHAALGSSAAQRASTLKMWWWGEQEAVGIQRWMNDTLKKFQQRNGVKVAATLMDTSNVIPQFTNAAAAGHPPDVQFLFNGIYHMENVWLGYVKPLNGLVSGSVLKASGATKMSVYEGKQYRVGFYSVGVRDRLQQGHFRGRGSTPNNPPKTWDAVPRRLQEAQGERATSRSAAASRTASSASGTSSTRSRRTSTPRPTRSTSSSAKLDWRNPRYYEHWSQARGAEEEGLLQRRHQLAAALPGHPAVRHGQGVDVLQHDAGDPELAEEARRRRTSASS